jgi:hypothetical protein
LAVTGRPAPTHSASATPCRNAAHSRAASTNAALSARWSIAAAWPPPTHSADPVFTVRRLGPLVAARTLGSACRHRGITQAPGWLSPVVGGLEKRGWVLSTPDPADGRYTLAISPVRGWVEVVDTAPAHVDAVRTLEASGENRRRNGTPSERT